MGTGEYHRRVMSNHVTLANLRRERRESVMEWEICVITMTLHWHNSPVYSLGNSTMTVSTKTDTNDLMTLVLHVHSIVGVVIMKVTTHYTWRKTRPEMSGDQCDCAGCVHGITHTPLLVLHLFYTHTHRWPAPWRHRSSRSTELLALLSDDGWANSGMEPG